MIEVVIIEDEFLAAQELKQLLMTINKQINVCAILQTVEASLDWFRKNKIPQLIFSDIHLGDGTCFEIFKELEINVPIIFCTAYDNFALSAFKNNGFDYLLKPVKLEDLERSFNKINLLLELSVPPNHASRFNTMLQAFQPNYLKSLTVFHGNRILQIPVGEINFIYRNEKVVVFTRGQKFEIQTTLNHLESQLDPVSFYRANRQFIISKSAVDIVKYIDARKLEVFMKYKSPEKLIISKSKSAEFVKWLKE